MTHNWQECAGLTRCGVRVTPNLKTQAGASVEGKVMAISPICD
jgi:hypothetical protein